MHFHQLDCDINIEWLQKIATSETANIVTQLISGRVKGEHVTAAVESLEEQKN